GDDGQRKTGSQPQSAKGIVQVVRGFLNPANAAGIARLFLDLPDIAELATCLGPRRSRGHASRHESFGRAVEMLLHLLAHLSLDGATVRERACPEANAA